MSLYKANRKAQMYCFLNDLRIGRGTLQHSDIIYKKVFVFSESARSEAVGRTRDVLLISVWIEPFSGPAKHSKCSEYI
jgi:hypothetical protein